MPDQPVPTREGFIEADGHRIHWEYFGDGSREAVCLLNGLAMHTKAWYGFLPLLQPEFDVLLYEFKADLNTYLAQLAPGGPKSLEELIAWNAAHQEQELKYFGQEVFVQAQAKGPLTEKAYLDALAKDHQMARTDGIDATMQKYQLDAIVAPTNGPPAPIDFVNGEGGSVSSSTVAAVAGYPSVTVPAGYTFGLPVGISFFGKPWSEGTLIKAAYAYEQASKLRVKPGFTPTVLF